MPDVDPQPVLPRVGDVVVLTGHGWGHDTSPKRGDVVVVTEVLWSTFGPHATGAFLSTADPYTPSVPWYTWFNGDVFGSTLIHRPTLGQKASE